MSKHEKYTRLKRQIGLCLIMGVALFPAASMTYAATSVVANNQLPGNILSQIGNVNADRNGNTMTVTQGQHNAVIKWDKFDVGGNATVNFKGPDAHYNTLNYVSGGSLSQIYGTINANNNGNIYIVNPAGVQIGNSAQINVGSLYVSNAKLSDDLLKSINQNTDINQFMKDNQNLRTDAELMSLGNINATNVTFEGNGRIVIDSERIKNDNGEKHDNFTVKTNNSGNVIIGYDAYNTGNTKGTYVGKDYTFNNVEVNGSQTHVKGYMWIEDVEQLQAIDTNLGGNYALRNSIDATATSGWNNGRGFSSLGIDKNGKINGSGFTGKFDGIQYNIFGLTINDSLATNVGLFGAAAGATINNVTLVGGSIVGGEHVGAIVGAALEGTTISNSTNSASVAGSAEVGGIAGSVDKSSLLNVINTGTITGSGQNQNGHGNVGGLVGLLENFSTINGTSYNLGNVSSVSNNVGGLVGHAINSIIGNPSEIDGKPVENVQAIYNVLDVTGAYNVGGIVGNMEGSTVQNAENSGTVTATGHTTEYYIYHTDIKSSDRLAPGSAFVDGDPSSGKAQVLVNVANVGGIAGISAVNNGTSSKITNVTNTGDVRSRKVEGAEYYTAGNVGGVVGRAEDTNITNATNKENEVRGAHNVGGIAGYFGGNGTVTTGTNNGGDIMATGARNADDFVTEIIRPQTSTKEEFIIGNIGGIVGYMDGDNVYVTSSANRGTVHTSEPTDPEDVKAWEKAANVGGVVGKIDRSTTKDIAALGDKYENAAVSNSYNTGDVLGYTGVGGVVGMMYNGEVAGSYNLGYLRTTRQSIVGGSIDSLNMGGVVGDTTEETNAKVLIYDVYNKGQIGDSEFNYFGRHVGGIVGRLSGTVEKAYNNGAIYNGYNVVGGIAGWMASGSIKNAFNTGNITVYNQNNAVSQVGGIAGAVKAETEITISNAYNLGTIRSFKSNVNGSGANAVGGIIGAINKKDGTVNIQNVYTTGNIYAGIEDANGNITEDKNNMVRSIYGQNRENNANINVINAYYIQPQEGLGFTNLYDSNDPDNDRDNSNKAIDFNEKDKIDQYQYDNGKHKLEFSNQTNGNVDDNTDNNWRIYDGNTPILNAFLPKAEDYFDDKNLSAEGIGSIQYGTAYDPLLTIIKANGQKDLSYNWQALGINSAAGIAVYGAGLTLNDFKATGGSGFFGGTIYADGALNINGTENINIGSAADIYGSAVNITTNGKVTIYGDVTATGNKDNGTTDGIDTSLDVDNPGNIAINAGDVDVYGKLTSASKDAQGSTVTIPGINDTAVGWTPGTINDPYESMADIADRFAHTTGTSAVDGNITINAGVDTEGNAVGDGNVNLYYGNKGEGLITSGGDLTVTGRGDVYVDSDLDIGGDITLTSTGADSEVLLTLTNIGKVQADRFTDVIKGAINGKDINSLTPDDIVSAVNKAYPGLEFNDEQAKYIIYALKNDKDNKAEALETLNDEIAVAYLHDFMHSFGKNTNSEIALKATSGNAKLTVDMWVENADGTGKYDFGKYDKKFPGTTDNHKFKEELDNLNFTVTNTSTGDTLTDANKAVYVEVSTGEQLKGIQDYVINSGVENASDALGFNYALMGDINASQVDDYKAIGGGESFTGTFDGRGNRIIGLEVNGDNSGIFSTVGEGGVVKDVNIYSGTFTGDETAGAVAGVNNGRIEGVVTFGNTVTSKGNAGGIVGVNSGHSDFNENADGASTLTGAGIYDVESISSVIAGSGTAIAGGLVGTNDGALGNSFSDSAVTVATGNTLGGDVGLGGVVGVNNGDVQYVDSLGVTNGGDTGSSDIGGIIGINNGNMYSGYNESIVSGKDNIGGIIGTNAEGKKVENVVNATSVTGKDKKSLSENVGGLIGVNKGNVTNGRNNGTITGTENVGGLVGNNADKNSVLTNLVNDSAAEITGIENVGGIAGNNEGTIITGKADDENEKANLINRGSITGHTNVGGVAGINNGTIENANNDVELNVNPDGTGDAQFFGGIAGVNTGTITNATNTANVNADGATYVGGIVGKNEGHLKDMAGNSGNVTGENCVGGVAGLNNEDIDGVNASNTGVVKATKGGAGGIFAENTGNITNSTLTNNKIVVGTGTDITGATGGIIGKNSGNISTSSLKNEIGAQVIGTHNVGGLIGYNTGTIAGGRDAADSYYKYQIYNNGVINVGTWDDKNGDKLVDAGEITFSGITGQNVGGLIGNNTTENGKTGSLTAGYNTGAINAGDSINVGGIAGTNEGTLDQVFSTIFDADGHAGKVEGGTNVGGLVGNNSGMLSNAYNTSAVAVKGNSLFGTLVGMNRGTGTVKNAYTTVSDKFFGSSTSNTSVTNVYFADAGNNKWKDHHSYGGFDFDTDGSGIWKNYDGYGNPLLKVFLTKAYYDPSTGQLIGAADGFEAHYNANGGLIFPGGMNNLWSTQIGFGNGNPNWLGYDLIPFVSDENWDFLYDDAPFGPFDRNRDFRERKAEINFVDGGMEI